MPGVCHWNVKNEKKSFGKLPFFRYSLQCFNENHRNIQVSIEFVACLTFIITTYVINTSKKKVFSTIAIQISMKNSA